MCKQPIATVCIMVVDKGIKGHRIVMLSISYIDLMATICFVLSSCMWWQMFGGVGCMESS